MNVTFEGGTAQQQAWVREAIAASDYPYEVLDVAVTVTWAPTTPCTLNHTYMCTKDNGDGTFTITIEDWADDPTHPNNAGLPDAGADIKTFYMQSFVHETGHVAHFTFINTDILRAEVAALFWEPDVNAGTGRRYGTLTQYDQNETTDLTWANAIIEAIAECVKCAFYQGRLIYGNRTNWRIDESKWDTLMRLVMGATGPTGGWADSFGSGTDYTLQGSNYGLSGVARLTSPVDGLSYPALWITGYEPFGISSSEVSIERDDAQLAQSVLSARILFVRVGPGSFWGSVGIARGYAASELPWTEVVFFYRSADNSVAAYLNGEIGDAVAIAPYTGLGWIGNLWLVQRTTATKLTSELWNEDPFTAPPSARLLSITSELPAGAALPINDPHQPQPARLQMGNAPATGSDVLFYDRAVTDWAYRSLIEATPPPYPFPTTYGSVVGGPGSAGTLRFT